MLHVIPPVPPLTAAEQFALDALVDQSRLLPADAGDGVPLRIHGSGPAPSIAQARARRWGVESRDGGVDLERPVLSLVVELAGAVREQRTDAADRYGRVPPAENALVAQGAEREPVVGLIAVALRGAATRAAEGAGRRIALLAPWPEGKRWAAALSHDLDVVALWPAYAALRIVELLGQGDVSRAARVAVGATAGLTANPVWRAAERLLAAERDRGIRSTWFVIAGTPTVATIRAGDVTYAPESPLARRIIAAAAAATHEIGVHGSFATFVSRDALAAQRSRLAAITSAPAAGVRQHFLRIRPGTTQVAMADAGFRYDSTFGFSERNGFRLGVADVVPVWDERGGRVLDFDEAPFVWMDRALSKYRHIEDPAVWIEDALVLAAACRQVDGLWTGVWHPNMDDSLGFPGAPAAFNHLCTGLIAGAPWAATLSEIVAWRRARRSARAAGVTPSGAIRLRATVPEPHPLVLEDPGGKRLDHMPA